MPVIPAYQKGRIVFMVELSAEQSEELRREETPRVVANGEEFVLVRTEVFEKIKGLIEDPNEFTKTDSEEIDESLYEAEDL
jgi:hypothetical protein